MSGRGYQGGSGRGGYQGGGRGGGGGYQGGQGGGRGGYQGGGRGGGGGGGYQGGPPRGGGGGYQGGPPRGGGGGFSRGGGRGGGGGNQAPLALPQSEAYEKLVGQQMKPGTEGRQISLLSNFYKVIIGHVTFMHYDMQCEIVKLSKSMAGLKLDTPAGDDTRADSSLPDRFIRLFGQDILKAFVLQNKTKIDPGARYVYDGEKNIYTVKPLFQGPVLSSEVKFVLNGRERTFSVKLSHVGAIPNETVHQFYGKAGGLDSRAIGAIDSQVAVIYDIFFKFLIMQTHEQFRHKFFNTGRVNEGNNPIVNYIQGFIKAVKPTEFGLGLNVHLKTGVVISKSLVKLPDLVLAVVNSNRRDKISSLEGLHPAACGQVRHFIQGLKVITAHTGREVIYTAWDLSRDTPFTHKFKRSMPDGNQVELSIAEYFADTYKLKLSKMPLLVTGNRKLIPLELCQIYKTQFLSHQKITPDIQQEMLRMSTFTPDVYLNKVQGIVEDIKKIDPELYKAFEVDLVTKPARITGRVLEAPKVFPGKRQGITQFKTPCSQSSREPLSYMMFSLQPMDRNSMNAFCGELQNTAKNFNVNLKLTDVCALEQGKQLTAQLIKNMLSNIFKRFQPRLFLVAIPTYSQTISPPLMYSTIKRFTEQSQECLVMTQCMKADYIQRTPRGYHDNILMKINAKLGGVNSILDGSALSRTGLNPAETMVIGVDVNHASPRDKVECSVTAVVASMDGAFTRFASSVRVQPHSKDELIENLGHMLVNMLAEYEKTNGRLPKNVVIMRDGVSDGQIELIFKNELPQVRRALEAKIKGAKLMWIVVQKRHNTRILLSEQDNSGRRPTFNMPSGTVVDQGIVDPTKYPNFYLNSHFSPLGTSKPARYVVLQNDMNLDTNQIQRLCFYLCFNCVRTNNVLAYPVTIRYADLCAYRAKLYVENALAFTTEMPNEAEMMNILNKMAQTDPCFKKALYYV